MNVIQIAASFALVSASLMVVLKLSLAWLALSALVTPLVAMLIPQLWVGALIISFPFLRVGELVVSGVACLFRPAPVRVFLERGKIKRVAVIGAGSSGIAAAKEALSGGLDVTVFEQTGDIGGNWVFREEEGHSSVYRTTVINTSKQVMNFSDFPMPPDTPTFPHHSQITRYFNSYADHFDVRRHIRFHTKVLDVALTDEKRWKVTFKKVSNDDPGCPGTDDAKIREDEVVTCEGAQEEEFDAVMVCNGHHSVPLWPNFPGQDKFKGYTIHSHSYKDVTSCDKGYDFRGKRILVVGVGNSGADLATELSRVTETLHLSTRSGCWVYPKYCEGQSYDHYINPSRLSYLLLPACLKKMPFFEEFLADLFERKVLKVQGSMSAWGVRPSMRLTQTHGTVCQDLLHRIGLGSIQVQRNVLEVHENGVTFEDGKRVELDAIVYCTGYHIRHSFIPKSLSPYDSESNNIRLYKHVFKPNHVSTLAYLALIQPLGAIMPIAELQARWIVKVWRGECSLPDESGMNCWIDNRIQFLWRVFLRRPRHMTQVRYFETVEMYAEEIGCVPRWWNFRNWKVLRELMMSPAGWPFTYRLQGPGSWNGAAEALRTAYQQIGKHP